MNNIPFKAALFDLDGTLLDSMYVWHRVDELFFESIGLPFDPEYGKALAGKSYQESAEYTIQRYGLCKTCEQVIAEWTHLSREEYARHVQLKPGALNYLRMLKRAGVKLAVATALPPDLYTPVLAHHGIIDMFDALCSTNDTGGRGKAGGEVYLLAAEKIGVRPEDCAVFEDVLEGIMGAKKAGMRAFCVKDSSNAHTFKAIAALADGMIASFDEMANFHSFPENDRRCVIFTARCEGDIRAAYRPLPGDFILCADGGWQLAEQAGARPDCVLGDFDSSRKPDAGKILTFPVEKDDTDTMLCLKHGLSLGFDRFLIVGGFGGRMDHTLANFQTLAYAEDKHARAEMQDERNWAAVIRNGEAEISPRPGKLSVFAMDRECRGVTIENAKYTIENAGLTNDFPLGMGNDFLPPDENGHQKSARIRVDEGTLLIVISSEQG